jgi:hypothetical protein
VLVGIIFIIFCYIPTVPKYVPKSAVFNDGEMYILGFVQRLVRFAMGGYFTTNVKVERKIFSYHKSVYKARKPAYCKCAVSGCSSIPNRHFLQNF